MHIYTRHVKATESIEEIRPFAELIALGDALEIRRITTNSILLAYENGLTEEDIINTIRKWSQSPIPGNFITHLKDEYAKLGKVFLRFDETGYFIYSTDLIVLNTILRNKKLQKYLFEDEPVGFRFYFIPKFKEKVKRILVDLGVPPLDTTAFRVTIKVENPREDSRLLSLINFAEKRDLGNNIISFIISEKSLWNALDNGLDPTSVLPKILIRNPPPPEFDLFVNDVVRRYKKECVDYDIPVAQRMTSLECIACGTRNDIRAIFCKKCGRLL